MSILEKLMGRGRSNHELNMTYDPNYANNYYQMQQKMQEQQLQQQLLGRQSEWMNQNREAMLGRPARPGLPSPNPELAPQPGTGAHDPTLAPIQRFLMERNFEMGASGQPALAEKGLDNSASMQGDLNSLVKEIVTKRMDSGQTTGIKEYLYARDQGFKGSFQDWKQSQRAVTQNNINMGNDFITPSESQNIVDSNGNPVQVPVGTRWNDPITRQWSMGQKRTAEQTKQATAFDSSLQLVGDVERGINEYGVDVSSLGGYIKELRSGTGLVNIAADKLMEQYSGRITPQEAEVVSSLTALSNTVLQALRGAAVGPAEQEKVDLQLPRPGQPKAVFEANLRKTKQNLRFIQERTNMYGGTSPDNYDWSDAPWNRASGGNSALSPGGSEDTDGPAPGFTWSD